MPPTMRGFPCRCAAAARAAIASVTRGSAYCPGTPSSAVKSFAPNASMSTPSTAAISSALATPAGVSMRICTTVASSSAGFSVAAGVGRMPNCGTVASCDRWPRGAKRQALATAAASAARLDAGRDDALRAAVEQAAERAVLPFLDPDEGEQAQIARCRAEARRDVQRHRRMLEVHHDGVVPG